MLTNDPQAPYTPACRTTPCTCDWYGDGPAPACFPCHVRHPGPGCGSCVPAAAAPPATAGAEDAQGLSQWVRAFDRLPAETTYCLVMLGDGHMVTAALQPDWADEARGFPARWEDAYGNWWYTSEVTHWQPLPDGPLD